MHVQLGRAADKQGENAKILNRGSSGKCKTHWGAITQEHLICSEQKAASRRIRTRVLINCTPKSQSRTKGKIGLSRTSKCQVL